MGTKSTFNAANDAVEKIQDVQETQGFSEIEKLAETVGLKQEADKALDVKDVASQAYTEKKELVEETIQEDDPSFFRKSFKYLVGGAFGLVLGKKFFGGKEKTEEVVEKAAEVTEEVVEIATDEERLRETNDTFKAAIEAEQSLQKANDQIDDKWKFEKEERDEDWFKELEKKEEKYKEYGHGSAWKEAWKKTEFEVDKETGEPKKRNFFWRLISFIPALTGTYASWRAFETAKKSGIFEKVKEGRRYREEADKQIEEANKKFQEGLEVKREAFGAIFEENPGAIQVSKDYLKKLANLTKNADKFSSPERAEQIRKIAREAVEDGAKKVGPGFSKMKGFEKYMPGISVNMRGKLMVVEIVGKALGQALREGAEGGGLSKALGVFWEELGDTETWKDAAPVWGTIRSAKRLMVDNDIPRWSKWLDFGLSAGMDIATGVAIAGAFATTGGLATPAVLAARTAAGAAVKGGVRKITLKQMAKQAEKAALKGLGKQSRKKATSKVFSKESRKSIALAAGGKWGVRVNLMMATIGEFFGEDMEAIQTEVKNEAYNTLLTPEQKYFIALEKAAKNGEIPPEREAILADEDRKRKEEIEHDEEKQSAGILAESSAEEEKEEEEEEEKKPVVEYDSKKSLKAEPKTTMKKKTEIPIEEKTKKVAA